MKRVIFSVRLVLLVASVIPIAAETMQPAKVNPPAGERSHGLITDRGWLTFAGGISPWASFKADRASVAVPDFANSGADFTFDFRFMHPLQARGLFAIGYSFHFFTIANAANKSPTALKATNDITGAPNLATQPLAARTFSAWNFGPSLIITYRFPLARYFAVSERTYPYLGVGAGVYYSNLTVQPLANIADKSETSGFAVMARTLVGFAVDFGTNVGAFLEAQFMPYLYENSGYVIQGQMHSMFAGFNYYFAEDKTR